MVVAEKRDKTLCVLVTGASRGIGLELVKQYLTRVGRGNYGRGGHVIATCRDPENSLDLLRCFQVDYVSYEVVGLDVANGQSFLDLHEHLRDLDGIEQKIDIVFNNAGVALGRDCAVGTIDYEAWPHVLKHKRHGLDARLGDGTPVSLFLFNSFACSMVNWTDVVCFVQAPSRMMRRSSTCPSDLGSIGKVMNGGFNTITQDVIYRSSKAALNMVTVCAAAELKSRAPDKKIKVIR